MTTECQHANVRTEERQRAVCRYIPSTWERYSDDDPFETVTIRDVDVMCSDCGEYLECITGD